MKSQPARIAVVEDNEDDVFLLQRALKGSQIDVLLNVLDDGEKALEFFERAGDGREALPDLVLLDLKLPYVHGLEVLEFIRQHTKLKQLDVIVLTSSAEARDQERAVALQVHGYHVKPPTPALVADVVKFVGTVA